MEINICKHTALGVIAFWPAVARLVDNEVYMPIYFRFLVCLDLEVRLIFILGRRDKKWVKTNADEKYGSFRSEFPYCSCLRQEAC